VNGAVAAVGERVLEFKRAVADEIVCVSVVIANYDSTVEITASVANGLITSSATGDHDQQSECLGEKHQAAA
jgi:hypothetical protein